MLTKRDVLQNTSTGLYLTEVIYIAKEIGTVF